MKLADYVINFLADKGIKDVFLVYGAANGDLVDAFTRNNKIRYVCVMHEQAGGFAAEAYSRVTQNFGVTLVTSGPGGHNLVTPIGNCYYESVPALFITGQPYSKFLKKTNKLRQNAFQETEIVEIVKPITKYAKLVMEPKTIKMELEKAMHLMKEGRPGPVLLDFPIDIQKAEINPDELEGYEIPESPEEANGLEIQNFIMKFINDLRFCKRPAVIIGGGIKLAKCEKELIYLLNSLGVPVFPTWNAFDTIASDYKYYGGRIGTFGGDGRNFGIQNCDLLLCLATRVSGRITGGDPSSFARGAKKYIVDIDAEILREGQHDVKFDHKLCCDIRQFLSIFSGVDFEDNIPVFPEWNMRVQEWKNKYKTVIPEYFEQKGKIHPYVFMDCLSKKLKANDVIVADCGGNIVVTSHALSTKTGQLFFSNNSNSPMGFSFAGAMGARVAASPDRNVVGIIGDGGMNMNIQEMQTLLNYNIGVKMIIINNGIYGITKAYQKINFNGRFEACGPKGYNPPDFQKISEAYGVYCITINVNNVDVINGALDEFLNYPLDKPIILNVDCHEYHKYVPRIVGWDTPIEDMYPYLPREEFIGNMIIEPRPNWKTPNIPKIET